MKNLQLLSLYKALISFAPGKLQTSPRLRYVRVKEGAVDAEDAVVLSLKSVKPRPWPRLGRPTIRINKAFFKRLCVQFTLLR